MTSSALALATTWALLMASACSASTPPGGREAAGSGAGSTPTEEEAVPTEPSTAGRDQSASQRATPASRPLPPGRFVTRADDGAVLAMRVGESRELRTRDGSAPEPSIEGEAVEAIGIDYVQTSSGRSWELRAIAPGSSRIVVEGREPFAVTIKVSAMR